MLDIRLLRTDVDKVINKLKKRNLDARFEIKTILDLDLRKRELSTITDEMKSQQKKASKQIPVIKKEGGNVQELMDTLKSLSDTIKHNQEKINDFTEKIQNMLLTIPNVPHESVCAGANEDDNEEIRRVGEVRAFEFEPKAHWDLGANLDILDPETAAKVTGARFHFYKGLGARLERAIINFYLDTHTANGYTEIFPPFMVNRASMTGTGQLPKFEEDAFKLEDWDYFLVPTAEVPITNMYRNDILQGSQLPIKYCAYSACFRAEAGSAGRDTRGLIRQHQFNKVELVKFSDPKTSYEELESLVNDAERVLQALELPYRVVSLCGGDLGFSSAKTYDIEVYMPSYSAYKEISSCSNFEDFQARRANIKFKRDPKEKAQLVHTLNGSGVAIGRTVAAILENHQNKDGSVNIPAALRPYMDGIEQITKVK